MEGGGFVHTKLDCISLDAGAIFEKIETADGDGDANSFEGL